MKRPWEVKTRVQSIVEALAWAFVGITGVFTVGFYVLIVYLWIDTCIRFGC